MTDVSKKTRTWSLSERRLHEEVTYIYMCVEQQFHMSEVKNHFFGGASGVINAPPFSIILSHLQV